jgi:hypothetical protein
VTLNAVAARERLLLGTGVTPVPAAGRRCSRLRWRRSTTSPVGAPSAIGIGAANASSRAASFDRATRWRLSGRPRADAELWAGPLGPRDVPIWIGGNSARARRLPPPTTAGFPTTTMDEMTMAPEDIANPGMRDIAVMGYSEPGDGELQALCGSGRDLVARGCTTGARRSTTSSPASTLGLDPCPQPALDRRRPRDVRLDLHFKPDQPKEAIMATTPDARRVADLSERCTGRVLGQEDEAYDDARRVFNGLIDRPRPHCRCRSTADAAEAVRLPGVPASTSPSEGEVTTSRAGCGGGRCDDRPGGDEGRDGRPRGQQREVRWSARATSAATAEHGLAVTGGAISTTGIAGFTLGGGLGG